MEDSCQGGESGGAILSKIFHTSQDGLKFKCPRVSGCAVANGPAPDSILMIYEEDTGEGGCGTCLGGGCDG